MELVVMISTMTIRVRDKVNSPSIEFKGMRHMIMVMMTTIRMRMRMMKWLNVESY